MGKLIKCKDCKAEISKKAKACPNCGSPTKQKVGCISSLISTIIVLGLFFLGMQTCLDSLDEIPQVPWEQQDSKATAYRMCADWVKERLKSPSTAKFPGVFDGRLDDIVRTNQRYFIKSYVDAQNSFGAVVRTNWTCSTTQKSEGNWTLNKINLLE